MKIRLSDNQIRARITEDEVIRLVSGEAVQTRVHFPSGPALLIRLSTVDDADEIMVTVAGTQIRIDLPASWAMEWTTTDRIGFEAVGTEGAASVLIEKDLSCKH